MLGLTSQPFWQDESYDRLVRNETEFQRIVHYIERSPVTAGLAATPKTFRGPSPGPITNRPQVSNLPYLAVDSMGVCDSKVGLNLRCLSQ